VSSHHKERSPLPAYIFAGTVTVAALILAASLLFGNSH
jgi:hypothetical protein